MSKKARARKVTDLKEQLEAYRASARTAGKGPTRAGNLAMASAAAGGAALAVAPAAEAVIQYSGPQNIIVTDYLYIDVDNDGYNDLVMVQGSSNGYKYDILFPLTSASFLGTFTSGFPLIQVKALSANYNIADVNTPAYSHFWSNGYMYISGPNQLGYRSYGPFPGAGPKYIGVRFINANTEQLHYGWVQAQVSADSSEFTIIDWAWDDTPNTPILAGATSGGGAPEPVPTLTEWGMIALITLLAGAAALKMSRLETLPQA